jgi:Domain of unknown function (DUF1737)
MGEVAKYQIVAGLDASIVAEKVNKLLKERYLPLGGISVTANNEKPFYAQAMVQYKTTSSAN